MPCIYMDGYYTVYEEKEDIELIAKNIIRVYENYKGQCLVTDVIMDREQMLDKVLFRLINTEKNVKVLRDMPHYDLCRLGLSVVFYLSLQTEGMEASVQINRGLMKIWDSSETELLSYAQRNTPKKMKAFICSLEDILHSVRKTAADSKQDWNVFSKIPAYVLTNEKNLYGAACILYDGVLERAAEQIGSGFYVLPSSLHEVILVPEKDKNNSAEAFRKMVAEINCSEALMEEDVLADEVYYYDRDKCELEIAV